MIRWTVNAAAAVFAALACACGGGALGGADACHAPREGCSRASDCCSSSCVANVCAASAAGGRCVTSGDCAAPLSCGDFKCAPLTCRQDGDVCALDAQCCVGNCTAAGRCAPNAVPKASAVAPASAHEREVVGLDATGSTDADGDRLTFTWSLAAPPASAAALTGAATAQPTFTTDVAGTYTATVTVRDATHAAQASATVRVVNTPPVAIAGADRQAPRNVPVQLDASASSDVDQDPLAFAWTVAGPGGAAVAVSPATDARPTFVPTRLGAYVATVAVSDGDAVSTAAVTITSVNTPPVAAMRAPAYVNAGEPVALDASGSSDVNSDALTFTWGLAAPDGSAAALGAPAGVTSSFVADVAGTYTVTLDVSDGIDTVRATRTVVALPHLWKLQHDVVAAEYVRASDRLVIVSASPSNALYVLDPATETETKVALTGGAPLSVGVSPDGGAAVVGRDGGVTAVDLATRAVTDCPVAFPTSSGGTQPFIAASVAVGNVVTTSGRTGTTARWAYATPGVLGTLVGGDAVANVNLATCAVTWVAYPPLTYFTGTTRLRPSTGTAELYVSNSEYAEEFYVYGAQGAAVWSTTASAGYTIDPKFWFFADGSKIVTESGGVWDGAPSVTGAFGSITRLGQLGNPGVYEPAQPVTHADHATAAARIAAIPRNGYGETTADTVLRAYDAGTFALMGETVLPRWAQDGAALTAHGRFVFWRSDATKRYVVLQADGAGGVAGVYAAAP